ncbi:HlyD family type I secretion periplasmic adaptor subunit [Ramlibacter sp.]|uniref:HlyD family type I secretion periplasmic adaptor subunit n=1 Tax=Ramlibacter sp. TaxID=1917967 RepID=UPI002D2C3067|nr:HlyD family type I secretion periplasmic adaptor subunit [Ramlibacter sp.]HYD75384.1 HlyD family type I secretion periplasmic adaptor subunit [Ramlibacter sp.]
MAAVLPDPGARLSSTGSELQRFRRLGVGIVFTALVLFTAWAALAPLDEGVPAAGQVSIDTKRKAVQHPTGGVVRAVHVKEGDVVAANALLMELDAGLARANLETVRQRYYGLLAMQTRLLAERSGAATIAWPQALKEFASDPQIAMHMSNQAGLLATRRAGLAAERQAAAQGIAAYRAQIAANEAALPLRRSQLASLSAELQSLKGLVAEGYAPRNRQRELERQLDDLRLAINDLSGANARLLRSIDETNQRLLAREAELRKEVESQLADVTREVQADAERINAVRDELARTEIRAPAAGQVVGLAFQTAGGVIPPTQKIMDIVPAGERLVIEVRVPPTAIDRVRDGTPVDVRFGAFAHAPQLMAEGKVLSISRDALTDAQTQLTYFLARVVLTEEGQAALGRREMQPGMPVEVVFRTGERTLLEYLLHPLTKRVAASMTEE